MMMSINLTDAAYDVALARGRDKMSRPYAVSARYDEAGHLLTVLFNTKLLISFDPREVDILKQVSETLFADVTVTPGGDGLIFGDEQSGNSIAVSLPGLLATVVPIQLA